MQTVRARLYDYPKYYDAIFGADCKAEFDFLRAVFRRYAKRPVRRVFEPACGTGRLLVKLAAAGYAVSGNDLNPAAVAYCNRRLVRHGFPATASVGDMAGFRLARPVDAAFNTVSSFRHLESEAKARSHLDCVATSLAPGGLYVLGIHLTPLGRRDCDRETWSVRRGRLAVVSRLRSLGMDRRRRRERIRVTFDVSTPSRQLRLVDEMTLRTYTAEQFCRLLEATSALEIVATFDFGYDIGRPIRVDDRTEDVVYVLRKRPRPSRRPTAVPSAGAPDNRPV